jgi:LysR family glycine cleavage system transcriptional activator
MDFSKLPNLNALRAFEAAARLESFSGAAQELFVTHGAVSHRIRTLEEDLGLALFVRDGKRVRLSEGGRVYAQQVRLALIDIAHATQAVRAGNRERRLVVSVLPSFAARWLMPRVGRFIELHPHIDLELMAATALVDFRRDDVDVGIRLGNGDYPGLVVERLMGEAHFPVCAPNFNQGVLPKHPSDLLSLPLQRSEQGAWRDWFDLADLPDVPEPMSGAFYSDSAMVLQAALDGQYVAIVRRSLAQDYLDSGRLIKLFEIESPSRQAYYFVCPEHVVQTERVVSFKNWLQQEITAFQASMPGALV